MYITFRGLCTVIEFSILSLVIPYFVWKYSKYFIKMQNITMQVLRIPQPETIISLDSINKIVNEYLLNVITGLGMTLEEFSNLDAARIDEFRFEASNNWSVGHDFVAHYTAYGYETNKILDIDKLTKMYLLVNEYYFETYGIGRTMRWNSFSPKNVMRHYVYYYIHGLLSHQELVAALRS